MVTLTVESEFRFKARTGHSGGGTGNQYFARMGTAVANMLHSLVGSQLTTTTKHRQNLHCRYTTSCVYHFDNVMQMRLKPELIYVMFVPGGKWRECSCHISVRHGVHDCWSCSGHTISFAASQFQQQRKHMVFLCANSPLSKGMLNCSSY